MRIIEPAVEIYNEPDHFKKIETIARVCTGTQDKVGSKPDFVENLWKNHHETPFEHVRIAVGWDMKRFYSKTYGFWDRVGLTKGLEKDLILNVRDYLTLVVNSKT